MALEVMARADAPIPLDVAFRVEPGELLALVGHSGSGKTTLLRTVAGLWTPSAARVAVSGRTWLDTATGVNLAPHRRPVGFVFQNYGLFPHMTAGQNVMAAMDRADPAEAARILDLVNLHGLSDRRPAQLSGGQQQRVALARALARRPQALLLDEPFSAVDRATRERLYSEILALRAHLQMPVVLVTHDVTEAQLLADRMVVIAQGRMVSDGSAGEVMADPAALPAMGVPERAALLPARIAEHLADGATRLDTAGGPLFLPTVHGAPGTQVRIRTTAGDVILSRARPEGLSEHNILVGEVTGLVHAESGDLTVHLAIGGHEILARITRRAANQLALQPGERVHAIIRSASVGREHVTLASPDGTGTTRVR